MLRPRVVRLQGVAVEASFFFFIPPTIVAASDAVIVYVTCSPFPSEVPKGYTIKHFFFFKSNVLFKNYIYAVGGPI